MLEGTAARLAAELLTHPRELHVLRSQKDQIQALPQQTRQTTEPNLQFLLRYSDLNNKFHAALVELSLSTTLQWTLARLQSVPFAAPSATIIPEGWKPISTSRWTARGDRGGHLSNVIVQALARDTPVWG